MVEEYGALCALCGKGEDWASNSYWNDKFGMLTVLSQQHAGKARSVITTSDPWNCGRKGWQTCRRHLVGVTSHGSRGMSRRAGRVWASNDDPCS